MKETAATWDKTTQQVRVNKQVRLQAVSLAFIPMYCTDWTTGNHSHVAILNDYKCDTALIQQFI